MCTYMYMYMYMYMCIVSSTAYLFTMHYQPYSLILCCALSALQPTCILCVVSPAAYLYTAHYQPYSLIVYCALSVLQPIFILWSTLRLYLERYEMFNVSNRTIWPAVFCW